MSTASYLEMFAPNPLRATENQIILQFTKSPIDFIKPPKFDETSTEPDTNNDDDNTNTNEENVENNNNNNNNDNEDGEQGPPGSNNNNNRRNNNVADQPAIAPTWNAFIQMLNQHPAIQNALKASSSVGKKFFIQHDELRYAVEPIAPSATTGFSNRFDQKLYESFITLIKAREDAEKSREEHDKIMATRPPPTPPVEENDDNYNNNNDREGREIEYDEDGNEIEQDEDEGNHNNNYNNNEEDATAAPPPRPRKTRAQRREEEKQRKEDKKREFEVEQKEHAVACLEQKLSNALCAAAIRVVVAP